MFALPASPKLSLALFRIQSGDSFRDGLLCDRSDILEMLNNAPRIHVCLLKLLMREICNINLVFEMDMQNIVTAFLPRYCPGQSPRNILGDNHLRDNAMTQNQCFAAASD